MKRTKIALLYALVLLLGTGLFFTGCRKTESTAAASQEPEKVHLYHWSNEANAVGLLEAFNKEYAGKYELTYEKITDSATMTINTLLASGADITVMTQSSAVDLRQRVDSGIYMGMKKFFDREKLSYEGVFGEFIEQTQNINGDYYALPYCNNIYMVYFNKKIFDANGIPYPDPNWTWADFREIARKLTKGSGSNKTYGVHVSHENAGVWELWGTIAQQKLGEFWYYNPDFKSTRFDAPEMRESLQFFYEMFMVDKSIVPYDEYITFRYNDGPTGVRALAEGKFAMWIMPVYGCLYLNANYGPVVEGTDVIGLANLPRPVGAPSSVSVCYTSTSSIPANVKNPEGAWTLIKYISIEHPEYFAGPKTMHPGIQFKSAAEAKVFDDIIFRNHPGLDYDMAMKVMALPRNLVTRDNTVSQGQAKINNLINTNMSLVFNGEMTVDAALRDLKTKGDQFIAEDLRSK